MTDQPRPDMATEQALIYARDLRQVYADLRLTEQRRRELMDKLIRAQEDERRRIAIDIHDDVLQVLGFNLMKIDLIEALWKRGDHERAFAELSVLRGSLEHSVNTLRDIITDIRPPSLDVQGLLPTLDDYLKRMERESGIAVTLTSRLERRQPAELEILIYRLLQESLVNVRKHSGAGRVDVRLWVERGVAHVEVEDDGHGFDVEDALARSLGRGSMGLHSLIERASLAGGRCSVVSEPGKGSLIAFELPVPS